MAYFEQTNINNVDGDIVNPATAEQILLLRRIVKLLESQATVDVGNRQRITLDAITAGVSLPTVAAVTAITNALPAGTNTIGSVNIGGADHRQFIDQARTAYNTGIRGKLTFS